MGGDHAPAAVVDGAIEAMRSQGVRVVLVGPEPSLGAALARHRQTGPVPEIVDAPDAIGMADAPVAALRRRPRASIRVAAELVARGHAAAVFSAGHTGAALVTAHAVFGTLAGVERAALAVTIPTRTGTAILVDAGANVDCRADHLVQFGIMGATYASLAAGTARPAVALLSIGEEAGKGNELVKEAHAGLTRAAVHFIGNLDAREIFSGRADVIVCDGFVGNVALKVGEGLVEMLESALRDPSRESGHDAARSALDAHVADRLATVRHRVDYAEHGAAPLLGVNGLVLVGHGRSSAQAICSGIVMAHRLAEARIVERLASALAGL